MYLVSKRIANIWFCPSRPNCRNYDTWYFNIQHGYYSHVRLCSLLSITYNTCCHFKWLPCPLVLFIGNRGGILHDSVCFTVYYIKMICYWPSSNIVLYVNMNIQFFLRHKVLYVHLKQHICSGRRFAWYCNIFAICASVQFVMPPLLIKHAKSYTEGVR